MKMNGLYIDSKGTKRWYLNDKLHREDGPAYEHSNGVRSWYLNGKLHREGGPAVESPNGNKEWLRNGKLHREDGPAIERNDRIVMWYLDSAYLGKNAEGFWGLWEKLTPEQQNNLNLHTWLAKYT